jgi:preprotein translocase subunit YajC
MTVMFTMIVWAAFIFAAFYFILLQPVLKQNKRTKRDISRLRVGDEILTTGGLIATVKEIIQPADGPTELRLELAPGIEVRALVAAVQQRLTEVVQPPEYESQSVETVQASR